MRQAVLKVSIVLLAAVVNACGYSTQPDYPPATVAVEGVRLTPQSVVLVAIGETRQLVATVAPANATDRAITWESSDASVASVDAAGVVTARAAGAGVFITVFTHDGHHQASVNVSVSLAGNGPAGS